MPKVSIIEHHDYLSLVLGNSRRFTINRSGYKASGIPTPAFHAMIKFCDDICNTKTGNPGKAIKALSKPETLSKLWPEWDAAPPTFRVGQTVQLKLGKAIHTGCLVTQVRGARVTVSVPGEGFIRLSADLLAKHQSAKRTRGAGHV